jgi:hypothetical protein
MKLSELILSKELSVETRDRLQQICQRKNWVEEMIDLIVELDHRLQYSDQEIPLNNTAYVDGIEIPVDVRVF